jgi:2-polyprenyl-3-methyl-5-hydroxy-6-metoxy-1,4-benzoquinol methylase
MNSETTHQQAHIARTDTAAGASPTEMAYIQALSREGVVEAYSSWTAVTRAEGICLDIAFEPGARVLDLGCGAGRFAMHLGSRCGTYLGVDASRPMLDAARENCPRLEFVEADIVEFAAETETYDVVLLMGNVLDCLHPASRRKRLLTRVREWLKPTGALVGSTHLTRPGQSRGYYSEDYHGAEVTNYRASLAETVEEVEDHGFEVVVAVRDYKGPTADWFYWVARSRVPGATSA